MVHCYTVLSGVGPFAIPDLDDCSHQVVCLSSCSEAIVDTITELLNGGDYLEGYILNDMISEILFNASDQMNRAIAEELALAGRRLTRRFSPGEGGMELSWQAALLACFREDHALDYIRLTDTFMLVPEKSMLYLFGADEKNPQLSVEHDCSVCPNVDCFFRTEK